MLGKAPSNKNRSSQDYVHVDVREDWLETHVSPGDAYYRFANDSRGVAQLIDLCRQRGVGKIYMKTAGEHGARARHALTFAGLSVTAANPLRARIFGDAGRARNARRVATISWVGATIALGLAGLSAWQWNRAEQTVELASDTTKGWLTQKLESAPGAIASFLADVARRRQGGTTGFDRRRRKARRRSAHGRRSRGGVAIGRGQPGRHQGFVRRQSRRHWVGTGLVGRSRKTWAGATRASRRPRRSCNPSATA